MGSRRALELATSNRHAARRQGVDPSGSLRCAASSIVRRRRGGAHRRGARRSRARRGGGSGRAALRRGPREPSPATVARRRWPSAASRSRAACVGDTADPQSGRAVVCATLLRNVASRSARRLALLRACQDGFDSVQAIEDGLAQCWTPSSHPRRGRTHRGPGYSALTSTWTTAWTTTGCTDERAPAAGVVVRAAETCRPLPRASTPASATGISSRPRGTGS